MKTKAVFYHAGCPICVTAEDKLAKSLDRKQYDVESVHLGSEQSRITEAESAGVQSVPALVLDSEVFHINYGASIEDLKGGA